MLDVRRLRILREVAQRGSLAGAADALSFTQPAVSKQIAQLERETGMLLVRRTSRGVHLTEPGRVLVAHTDEILARLAAAETALHDLAGLRAGTISLAAFPSAFAALVPAALRSFRRAAPGVDLDVGVLDPPEAIAGVRRGELDLAVVYDHQFAPLPPVPGLDRHPLLDDAMLAALPNDHPRAKDTSVALTDLRDDAWVQAPTGPWQQLVHQACLAAGFAPRITARTTDPLTAQGLVAAGVGVTLLPALALPTARSDIALRRITPTPPSRAIALVTPSTTASPATTLLRHTFEQTAHAHTTTGGARH